MKNASIAKLAIGLVGSALLWGVSLAQGPTDDWKAPARHAQKKNPIATTPATITQGKELFIQVCASCHGPEGKGDGPAAAFLERKPANLSRPELRQESDGALFWKINVGKAPMPAFEAAFTEEQRWKLVQYVRSLALRALARNERGPQ